MENELPVCPVEITLRLIGSHWRTMIIKDLFSGPKSSGELEKSLNAPPDVLAQNLKEMEEDGLLSREIHNGALPKILYALTETGNDLKPVFDSMAEWGNDYKYKNRYNCFI